MTVDTTPTLEDRQIRECPGIVTDEVIVGANIFKGLFAGIPDIAGRRAGAYESTPRDTHPSGYSANTSLAADSPLSAAGKPA